MVVVQFIQREAKLQRGYCNGSADHLVSASRFCGKPGTAHLNHFMSHTILWPTAQFLADSHFGEAVFG